MTIKRYPNTEIGPRRRPAPADRVECYQTNDMYRHTWMQYHSPYTIVVDRTGGDQPTDEWVFDVGGTSTDDSLPREDIKAAPVKHKYTPLEDRNGTPVCRFRGRRKPTKSRQVSLSDVPEPVLEVLRGYDNLTVVETLGGD